MAVARVHVRAWQVGYRGLLPEEYLDGLRAEDRAAKYDFASGDPLQPRTMVAVEGGLICGFATTAPARDPALAEYGELSALYVDPEQWGRGIGVALVGRHARGCSRWGFAMRCFGCSRETFARSVFIGPMGGRRMARGERIRCGA